MGVLIRDTGDLMDDIRPGTYVSDRGWTYRLLPSLENPGAWRIYPEAAGDLTWLGPGWPGYIAVPLVDETYGSVCSYAIYRADQPGSEPIAYAQNLADMCWPAEENLIVVAAGPGMSDTADRQEG